MTLGFIGLGNMADAIIGGILKEGLADRNQIIGSTKTRKSADAKAEKYGISVAMDNCAIVKQSDVVFLAVKPQFLPEVIEEIKEHASEDTLFISIAAGKTISYIEERFGREIKLVRCMPNTPALVLEGCTGYCVNENVSDAEKEYAHKLLSSFGKAIQVPEKLIDVVGGVSGSSPAFVFTFIEALADGAVAQGMPRAQAYEFAAQAVYGSAKLCLETGMHPGQLKDMVCSPGGSTIQGMRVLEEKGMRSAVMDAVIACVEKNRQL
ncbi:MAG: pyrroline-5-carboxylate reductase [Lachnospiraceae bacterium]|nr:pyrroline-5-carboxylate reductase [Lachnospiraceae bacterium]